MLFKNLAVILLLLSAISAKAAFVDTDPYCISYGCVVVSDDNTSDVYDVYNYTGISTVPVGGQLNDYGSNPIAGSGTVDPLFTNTSTNVSTFAANQAARIQISNQLGGGVVTSSNGLLDASTTITKFGIQSATKIDYATPGAVANLGDNPQSHSFYITSRNVSFNIRATATVSGATNEFPVNVPAANIGFLMNMTQSGTAATSSILFGTNTNANPQFVNIAGLSLANLSSNPIVASFNANIYNAANSNANIYTKSVRLNSIYTLPAFDLSQGRGEMRWTINFSFWRK